MSPSHSILRFVFLATLSIASLSATGTSSTTAIPDPDLLSGDGGGGLGNRHLRGGTIRRQEQQRRQLLHSFNPTVDIYWLALHHHHDPSPLPASHRQIQDSTPPTNNVHDDDARRHSFVQQCTSFLLSSDIIHDGIISQIDFVDMLLHQCRLENLCNISGLKLNFGQLDVSLRKKFIRGICKPTTSGDGDGDGDYPPEESRFECIYKLYEMMREESIFGFDANVAGVDVLVKDMCYETYPGAVDFGFVSRTQGE